MSHVVTIQTKVQDRIAMEAACRRLQWPEPIFGIAELYSGSLKGWQVQLPGWQYPVVLDLSSGDVHFDKFSGKWKA